MFISCFVNQKQIWIKKTNKKINKKKKSFARNFLKDRPKDWFVSDAESANIDICQALFILFYFNFLLITPER